MFAPLHSKSDRSPGYGTASVEELLRRSAEHGYPALALTDVENLYDQVKFHHAARHHALKPITGLELRAGYGAHALGAKARRLVLIARDREGYETLCRIVTRRRTARERETPEPLRALDADPRGVFFLSDDPTTIADLLSAGVAASDVRYLDVRPRSESATTTAPTGVRAVADTDIVMLDAADRELHALVVAIRTRRRIHEVGGDVEPGERSLAAPARMRELFRDAPGALAESLRIADSCTLDLTHRRAVFPSIALPPTETADRRLAQACMEALAAGRGFGRWRGPGYAARLDAELDVLARLGFAPWFLVAAEIAAEAERRGIEIAGRGSVAGSLVSHVLGLTQVDPIEHGLFFERFIHPARRGPPDIDLDLPSDRREEILAWIFRRFGEERVAMVSAHQTFGRRGAWREGLKALGARPAEIERFAAALSSPDLEADLDTPFPADLLESRLASRAPLIERLVGKLQHLAVHPGGVVIVGGPIENEAPLERAPKGVVVTQYDTHALEKLGLAKIDVLGNRALSALAEVERSIGRPLAAPDRDPATLEMLRAARTIGCFQIETPTLRAILRKLPIRGLSDVMAAIALVRPGPASGAAKASYVRRAHGEEEAAPPHPRLASLLAETHGIPLYEEQILAAIAELTAWPLARADAMRAAIADSAGDARELEGLRDELVAAALEQGVPAVETAAAWEVLARFAAYSFNKAHAASYARLAWRSAYARTHFPAAFACAVLNHYGGHYPLRTVAADFARSGVTLLAPHVNVSARECTLEDGAVRLGLASIRRVTERSRSTIVADRPFRDLGDLLVRAPLPFRELEALVLCGACDGLAPLDPAAYPIAHEDALRRLAHERSPAALEGLALRSAQGARAETYRRLVRARNEIAFLDVHPSGHPMSALRDEAASAGCVPIAELDARAGAPVRIAGVVASARRLAVRRGQVMQFVTIEDETGTIETVLFPGVYAALGDPVSQPGPFFMSGHAEDDHGDRHLVVWEVKPFHQRSRPYGRVVTTPP
jgi:DNA-directed DNA polymerase III PolC